MRRIKLTIAMLAVLCATTAGLWPLTAVKGQSGGLAAPTGVAASDGSYNNKIGISWDVMRGATQYQVFRHTANDPAAAVSLGTTVAAELPPFDRPLLYSESMRVPQIIGSGLAGAGGQTPQPIALESPLISNPSFTVAVQDALGGATATLVIDQADPGATANVPATASFARLTVQLRGTGAGNGYGSASLAIPDHPSLVGTTLTGRWYIDDPSAPQGVAVTPAFMFTIFGSSANTAPAFASVSAASFALGTVAPESILAGFGTGLRNRSALAAVTATIGGTNADVSFAGAQGSFTGLDQLNLAIPRSLAGRGNVDIVVRVDRKTANTVTIDIK